MSKRYTDIDALVAMLRNNNDLPFNGGDSWAHIAQIKDKLIEHIEKNAPAADVVEVVRCVECNRAIRRTVYDVERLYWCNEHAACVKPDDYCSYGKRKDGADNATGNNVGGKTDGKENNNA